MQRLKPAQAIWDKTGQSHLCVKEIDACTIQAVLEPADEGGFTVYVPMLQACISEGDAFEEAVENMERLWIHTLKMMIKSFWLIWRMYG